MAKSVYDSEIKTLLLSGFLAGTLDILCAILFLANGNAEGTLRFIARGALGDTAIQGGPEMVLTGLLFHYIIAFSFSIGYFVVYPYAGILKKNKILSGLFYGLFVWAFMQYIVLPLTYNAPGGFDFSQAWKGMLILMLAVGLPIAWITDQHYKNRE